MFHKSLIAIALALTGATFHVSAVTAQTPLTQATVQSLRKQVRLMPSNQRARAARVSDRLVPGDAVSTARQSLVELRFNDRSLARIGEQALFHFAPNTRTFDLRNGTVLMLIPRGQGVTRLKTPNAAAGIKGSALFARYIEETNTSFFGALTQSEIEISNQDGTQRRVLQPGEMATVTNGQIVNVQTFDLRRFYETSSLTEGLDLTQLHSSSSPDAALDTVREETVDALRKQAAVRGDEVTENPDYLKLPARLADGGFPAATRPPSSEGLETGLGRLPSSLSPLTTGVDAASTPRLTGVTPIAATTQTTTQSDSTDNSVGRVPGPTPASPLPTPPSGGPTPTPSPPTGSVPPTGPGNPTSPPPVGSVPSGAPAPSLPPVSGSSPPAASSPTEPVPPPVGSVPGPAPAPSLPTPPSGSASPGPTSGTPTVPAAVTVTPSVTVPSSAPAPTIPTATTTVPAAAPAPTLPTSTIPAARTTVPTAAPAPTVPTVTTPAVTAPATVPAAAPAPSLPTVPATTAPTTVPAAAPAPSLPTVPTATVPTTVPTAAPAPSLPTVPTTTAPTTVPTAAPAPSLPTVPTAAPAPSLPTAPATPAAVPAAAPAPALPSIPTTQTAVPAAAPAPSLPTAPATPAAVPTAAPAPALPTPAATSVGPTVSIPSSVMPVSTNPF